MIKNNLRKLFKQKFGAKQDVLLSVPGQLGNGLGVVAVPGRNNFVYVRVAGFVEEVYNSRVQADNDMPVIVGYDPAQPKLYQVLTTRMSSTGTASGGYAPAIRYQWMATGGGQDPLFVDKRQLLPKRIGPGGGMLLRVMRDIVWTGTAWAVLDTQTADLTSYVPTNASAALYVLVTLNTSGAVVLTAGAETTVALLALTDIPAVPPETTEVLGAVRVYTGQTAIQEFRTNTDVVDLRWAWKRHMLDAVSASTLDAVTDAVTEIVSLEHESSGTPAAGFGARMAAYLESSTTAKQLAGAIDWIWHVATHATRSAYARLMLTLGAATVTKNAYVGAVAIANDTTTNLFDVALAENSGVGGEITFTAIGTNGTDIVVHTGFVTYAAVDKAGTLTSQITDEGATSDATAKSSGSVFSDLWSIVDGTNKITIAVNLNSNMSGTTTWSLHYNVHNGSGQELTIL